MGTETENEVERIFNRQFQRCKAEVEEVNCPQIYIDSISKYFNFAKKDISDVLVNGINGNIDNQENGIYGKNIRK